METTEHLKSTFCWCFLGLGAADGSSCRNQKLLPSTMNTGVRLSIQWWHLQKLNKKGRGKELDPSLKKGI